MPYQRFQNPMNQRSSRNQRWIVRSWSRYRCCCQSTSRPGVGEGLAAGRDQLGPDPGVGPVQPVDDGRLEQPAEAGSACSAGDGPVPARRWGSVVTSRQPCRVPAMARSVRDWTSPIDGRKGHNGPCPAGQPFRTMRGLTRDRKVFAERKRPPPDERRGLAQPRAPPRRARRGDAAVRARAQLGRGPHAVPGHDRLRGGARRHRPVAARFPEFPAKLGPPVRRRRPPSSW